MLLVVVGVLLVILTVVGLTVRSEMKRDRKLAHEFNEAVDKVVHS